MIEQENRSEVGEVASVTNGLVRERLGGGLPTTQQTQLENNTTIAPNIRPTYFSPTVDHFHSSLEGVNIGRVSNEHPISFINLSRDRRVFLKTTHFLTDFDDTIALGSGQHAHDNHEARFALALSSLLVDLDRKSPFLSRAHREELERSNGSRIFSPQEWQKEYEIYTGRPEEVVMAGMLERAQTLCNGVHQLRLPEYYEHLNHIHETQMAALLSRVTLDEGPISLARSVRSKGGKSAICSASGNEFLNPAAIHLLGGQQNVSSAFNAVFGGVAKKLQCGNYTGTGIAQSCQKLGIDPTQSIMLGDTISDVAAAIAGVPVIVIRVPDHGERESDEARGRAIYQKMQDLERKVHCTDSFKAIAATVIQVHDFSQLVIEHCPNLPQSTFQIP